MKVSETSEDKTKRSFITLYNNNYFTTQISIFYLQSTDGIKAQVHKPVITQLVRRIYSEQCFLYRLCLTTTDTKNLDDLKDTQPPNSKMLMSYHTLFTNEKINSDKLKKALEKHLNCTIRIKQQYIGELKKMKYISAVKKGEPHDLKSYFNSSKNIHRIATINAKKLPNT
jgi:hypothetical protein